jgi:pimeloyl-ACP methyl ester carboxylesterase
MLGASIIVAGLLGLFHGAAALLPVSPTEFRTWFDSARQGQLTIPTEVRRNSCRFRYVFVAGFANERMWGYFSENAKELRALGVSRRNIHVIYPSSHKGIDENGEQVRREMLAVAQKGPEPLVVIAHSRGACDTLAFALRNPEFVADRVEALFLIQGPFGGTALADYVHGKGPSMDRRLPAQHRVFVSLLGRFERLLERQGWHNGLPDLTRQESRRYWSMMQSSHADAVPIVSQKTYFIQTGMPPSKLGRLHRSVGWFLFTYDAPNDGIVAVRDQCLPGLGACLGVLNSGHGQLTSRAGLSRSSRQFRRGFTQAILMVLGKTARESEPPVLSLESLRARVKTPSAVSLCRTGGPWHLGARWIGDLCCSLDRLSNGLGHDLMPTPTEMHAIRNE